MLLLLTGAIIAAASFLVGPDRQLFAIVALLSGVTMASAACVLPWILRLQVGKEGLSLEVRPEGEIAARAADPSSGFEKDLERGSEEARLAATRFAVANEITPTLLDTANSPLPDVEYRLFLYDEELGKLLPAFEPGHVDHESEGWEPGTGAVGTAWVTGSYIAAGRPAVSDRKLGLSEAQQARHADLTAVAAAPVEDDDGDVIAVLAASSKDPHTRLLTDEGFYEHLARTAMVSRVLVDVLGWSKER
ncbi:MAG TPA: hypothetical protein VK988_02570 [Acidimicrobiales bacterium]|nr:hypothetical protein [Acidimicrobiales bacterium]